MPAYASGAQPPMQRHHCTHATNGFAAALLIVAFTPCSLCTVYAGAADAAPPGKAALHSLAHLMRCHSVPHRSAQSNHFETWSLLAMAHQVSGQFALSCATNYCTHARMQPSPAAAAASAVLAGTVPFCAQLSVTVSAHLRQLRMLCMASCWWAELG